MPAPSASITERIFGAMQGAVLGAVLEMALRFTDVRDHVTSRSEFWTLDAEWFQFPLLGLVLGGLWPALPRGLLFWFDDNDRYRDNHDGGAGILGVLLALVVVALLAGFYVLYLHRPAGR